MSLRNILLSTVLLLHIPPLTGGMDVFCGELEVHELQRFGKESLAIHSQQTTDLKQCLELCCGIPNCDGVSFTGFIAEPQTTKPNCLFVNCKRQCQLSPKEDLTNGDGVISVVLKRHPVSNATLQIPDIVTEQTYNGSSSSSSFPEAPWSSPPSVPESSSHGPGTTVNRSSLTPVWVVGLAIVIAVMCIGLNLSLISAYICYRRKQSKKRKAQISSNKGPTLHAYNPTI